MPQAADDFSLDQLKLTHIHFHAGLIDKGTPISTTIQLNHQYNLQIRQQEWLKTTQHTYHSLDGNSKATHTSSQVIDQPQDLLNQLQAIDLRHLKNNYYTNKSPHRYYHWEIEYNHFLKLAVPMTMKLTSSSNSVTF